MKRKYLFYVVCLSLLICSSFVFVYTQQIATKIDKLSELLSPDNIGVLYREEIASEVVKLKSWMAVWSLVGVTLLASTIILLILSFTKKTFIRFLLTTFLTLVLLSSLVQTVVSVGNLYYRPRAELPKTIDLGGATRTFNDAKANITIQCNDIQDLFVAFLLAIGNPNTLEFIEVGYFQNRTGYYLYSSSQIGIEYQLIIFGGAVVGDTYNLRVASMGYVANARINEQIIQKITFSNVDYLEYVVQAETPYPYNTMNGEFRGMRVGYWKLDTSGIYSISPNEITPSLTWIYVYSGWPEDYVTATNESPYTISLQTEGSAVIGATISSKPFTPSYSWGGCEDEKEDD